MVREVSMEDVRSQTLDQMPGFRFSWYYSGMEEELKPESKYSDRKNTQAFVRYNYIYKIYVVAHT